MSDLWIVAWSGDEIPERFDVFESKEKALDPKGSDRHAELNRPSTRGVRRADGQERNRLR